MNINEIKPEQLGDFPGCMLTYTGKLIDLFNTSVDDICIEDIAHGLANTCRWNGHTKQFFSVAQHCCMMADMATENQLAYLLHDAEEAYWGDIIKPLKAILAKACPDILQHMDATRNIVYKKFGVFPADYKELDEVCLHYEFECAVKTSSHAAWSPEIAEQAFLSRFKQIYLHEQY